MLRIKQKYLCFIVSASLSQHIHHFKRAHYLSLFNDAHNLNMLPMLPKATVQHHNQRLLS